MGKMKCYKFGYFWGGGGRCGLKPVLNWWWLGRISTDAVLVGVYSPSTTCFPHTMPHRHSLLLLLSPHITFCSPQEGKWQGKQESRSSGSCWVLGSSHSAAAFFLPCLAHKRQRKNVKAKTKLLHCGHQDHMETSVSSPGISLGNLVEAFM